MAIWLNNNAAAYLFIPQSFWEGAFEQVKEDLASNVLIYYENGQVLKFIGITGNESIAELFVAGKAQFQGNWEGVASPL